MKTGLHVIYKATSPSGKVYIGYTSTTLKKRIQHHFSKSKAKNPNDRKRAICCAIRKYGKLIKWEILATYQTKEFAFNREKYFIKLFQSNIKGYGYNLSEGGEGRSGSFTSSKSKKIVNDKGVIFNSISQAGKSINVSAYAILMGIRENRPVKGINFDYYTDIVKIAQKNIGKVRPVYCIETNQTFLTCAEAGRVLNLHPASIHKVCSNLRKACRGYTFRFITGGGL